MEDHDQRLQRLEKLTTLRANDMDPYRIEKYERTHSVMEILDGFEQLEGLTVSVAGRVLQPRIMGKAAFCNLKDESGMLQLYIRRDEVGDESYKLFKDTDIGDIVGVKGKVFKTRTGEISLHLTEFTLLAKCLRVLPIGKEKDGTHFYSMTDVEQRHRMRYVDLLVNPEAREIVLKRCKVVQAMRGFLDGKGFLEVETPVLQQEAGGAAARPFKTHHNALDYDFKLRISLELYLKRLIVAGFEKVYEIGRVFRNEGISTRHNPEFTLMELYQAYVNLEDVMDLVEEMYAFICIQVNGLPTITHVSNLGEELVDFSARPWRRIPMLEGIEKYAGVKPEEFATLESAKAAARSVGIQDEHEHTIGGIIEKLHERFTQPNLIQPTFITDFPLDTSPLAKKRPDNPSLTRRFEIYVAGQELGNAFSEINDPLDQRERFEQQIQQRDEGNEEAHPMDEDYLRALEYGMPPTGGLGVGVDRLAALLTGAPSLREVILFPLLRPEK